MAGYESNDHEPQDYESWNESRADEVIAARAGEAGATLLVLHDLQAAFGYVPAEAVPMVAHALNLTRAEACQALGCEALADHVRARLNIAWHETTSDDAVRLEPIFCLGLCAIGPSALLDGQPLARLDSARIDAELEALS